MKPKPYLAFSKLKLQRGLNAKPWSKSKLVTKVYLNVRNEYFSGWTKAFGSGNHNMMPTKCTLQLYNDLMNMTIAIEDDAQYIISGRKPKYIQSYSHNVSIY